MFTMIYTRDIIKTARVLTIEQTGIFKVVISPEDPDQQLLDTCLPLDTFPSANAVADKALVIKEVLTVIAKRAEHFLKNCCLNRRNQFCTLTNGEVSTVDELPWAGAIMSLERVVQALCYSDRDLQDKHASGESAVPNLSQYPLITVKALIYLLTNLTQYKPPSCNSDSGIVPCLPHALVFKHLLTIINACHQAVCTPVFTLQAQVGCSWL